MPIQFITPSIISSVANTQVTGTITASQIATVNASTVTTGTLPSARLPTGSVLQVVQTVKTDTFSSSSTSFTDITGLSVSITPISSSSKILVMYNLMTGENSSNFPMVRLVRGSTAIAIGDVSSSRQQVTSVAWSSGATNASMMQSMNFLDSPATTSSTTYKLQISAATAGGTNYINRNQRDADGGYEPRGVSTITVMEIAA